MRAHEGERPVLRGLARSAIRRPLEQQLQRWPLSHPQPHEGAALLAAHRLAAPRQQRQPELAVLLEGQVAQLGRRRVIAQLAPLGLGQRRLDLAREQVACELAEGPAQRIDALQHPRHRRVAAEAEACEESVWDATQPNSHRQPESTQQHHRIGPKEDLSRVAHLTASPRAQLHAASCCACRLASLLALLRTSLCAPSPARIRALRICRHGWYAAT